MCRILKVTIWRGSLITWTKYVAVSLFPAFPLISSRLSMALILPAPLPENVYAN